MGELVDHGSPLGDADRVMIGQYGHAESDADVLGALRQRAEHHLRAGRAGEAVEEVVLHEPKVVETDLVGQFALRQRFLV